MINDAPYDLAAVMHVHSTYSDGSASVPEILEAAEDAEADAVFLTDHDTLQARRDGYEGWHQGVLLLVGLEISPSQAHFLAFGMEHELDHQGRSDKDICAAVQEAGGLGFPAHPWRELEDCPITGIELWSHPEEVADHPPARNLAEWDRLCRRRPVVAIGGLDGHRAELGFPEGRVLSPLRNRRCFRVLRTHVLLDHAPTGRLEDDRRLVLDALRRGRCFLGRDSLARTRNFRFFADTPAGFVPMGGEAPFDHGTLRVRLPLDAQLRIIRDGREIQRCHDCRKLDLEVEEPGVYRVEAWLEARGRMRTWIISNPVYLRP